MSINGLLPDPIYILLIFAIIFIALSVLIFYFYLKNKKTLFEISFAGGNISFDTSWLNQKEIQEFQNSIRLTKDSYEEQRDKSVSVPFAETGSPISAADEIKKYRDLLSQGIISEEEFNNIKNKLIEKCKQ